jgi:hypothetical protein
MGRKFFCLFFGGGKKIIRPPWNTQTLAIFVFPKFIEALVDDRPSFEPAAGTVLNNAKSVPIDRKMPTWRRCWASTATHRMKNTATHRMKNTEAAFGAASKLESVIHVLGGSLCSLISLLHGDLVLAG